jgi:F-box protein 21
MAARPAFTDLPPELLEGIFLHLDPRSLVTVAQTCKDIKTATDAPVIWRHYCLKYFKSWAPSLNITAKFAGPLSDVDWRALFIRRVHVKREVVRLLDGILASQRGRISRINQIAEFGYDAKETLLEECACPDDAEDVLARRYYANAVLERIQRDMAINVWKDLAAERHVPIETGLGAYDMFTHTGEDVDFDIITQDLDRIARCLVDQHPDFRQLSTRLQASTLASFLRDQGYMGVADRSYRALRNSFIGLVLRSDEHESLPLISVAIYSALAKRLGLDARPCGFIHHVYCLVYAPPNYDLDGKYKPTSSAALDSMYLDPFRSSDEVRQHDLVRMLRDFGVPRDEHHGFLSHTTTREMTLRTARNIMNSVQTIRQTETGLHGVHSTWMNAHPDMDNSFYAAIWAMLLLESGPDDPTSTRRRQFLPYLLEHFQIHYPWDVTLLQVHLLPIFHNQPEAQRLHVYLHSFQATDEIPRAFKRRTSAEGLNGVPFRVGQLFQHKRYLYEGVIIGWDSSCEQGEEWIQHMGVDQLPKGRNQSFYKVLYVIPLLYLTFHSS